MKLASWACIGVAALSATVACSSNESASPGNSASTPSVSAGVSSPSVRPTLTDPKLQPPSQQANQYSDGLPDVVFDPCTWIGDQTIKSAGFDPASRHRISDMVAEQTFMTCGFTSFSKNLNINSGNVPWDQDLQKHAGQTQPLVVNGRQAIWVHDPTFRGSCEIDLRTKVGFVQIIADLTDNVNVNQVSACDGLLNTATVIEPEIGKDN